MDAKRRDVEFKVGDQAFLKISPMKGVKWFGKKGKLSPRFIGPFEILDKVGPVAYRLALPPALADSHNVFHISMLRKYVSDPSHVLKYDTIALQKDLSYEERPISILDRGMKQLRSKSFPIVKVLWSNSSEREATWELEEDMQGRYPELFGK